MIDLNKYQENQTEKTTVEGYEGGFYTISDNSYLNSIWQLFLGVGRWYAWKYMFYYCMIPLIVAGAVYMGTDKNLRVEKTAGEMSTKMAGDNWFGALEVFTKSVIKKSTKLNEHEYYHLPDVKQQEADYYSECGREIRISKLFKYYVYENQDYLIMKSAAEGCNGDTLKLELSTGFTDDAEDYCENNFDAHIWDDELKKAFRRKIMLGDKKGELTQDNDDGAKHFRCVIMPDTIEDALDD